MSVALQAGKFFKDTNNDLWLCYRVDLFGPVEGRCHCLRVKDDSVSHFYPDGRFESTGTHKKTLSSGPL